ncbi:hypothetical protein, partial [Faecalibaculum rodentium]|uniref:hypothetical protein n=1 Tax=Faecalibaculum rodentium TaxID=1702221 RepID=UPI0023F2D456
RNNWLQLSFTELRSLSSNIYNAIKAMIVGSEMSKEFCEIYQTNAASVNIKKIYIYSRYIR